MKANGRVTIPTDLDVIKETLDIMDVWGADAIRDCDGTEFPEELKKAFNRWVTYKYTRGDAFKNYYAVDKVGQAIESHSKDYAGRVNERSTNQVVKLIDYCITTNTKSVCWSQIYSI